MQCLYIIDYLIGNRNAPANRGSGRRRGQRPPRYSNTQSQQNSSQFSQGNSQSLASQVKVHPHVYLPGNFLSKICTEDRYCYLNLHVCTFTNEGMSKSYPCLVGCLPAILPGTAHPGPHVHEPAVPDESAWIIWTLPARTLSGLIFLLITIIQ